MMLSERERRVSALGPKLRYRPLRPTPVVHNGGVVKTTKYLYLKYLYIYIPPGRWWIILNRWYIYYIYNTTYIYNTYTYIHTHIYIYIFSPKDWEP